MRCVAVLNSGSACSTFVLSVGEKAASNEEVPVESTIFLE